MQKTPEEILEIVNNLLSVILAITALLVGALQLSKKLSAYRGQNRLLSFILRNWGVITASFLWSITLIAGRIFNHYSVDIFSFLMLALFIIPSHERGIAILRQNSVTWRRDLLLHVLKVYFGYNSFIVSGCLIIFMVNPSLGNQQALSTIPDHLIGMAGSMFLWSLSTGIVTPLTWNQLGQWLENIDQSNRIRRLV